MFVLLVGYGQEQRSGQFTSQMICTLSHFFHFWHNGTLPEIVLRLLRAVPEKRSLRQFFRSADKKHARRLYVSGLSS
jgi:hypothetical protein